jgi:hypothetical protein
MQLKNKRGGKRAGAGRPLNFDIEKTQTISFRVNEYAFNTIQSFFSKLTPHERQYKCMCMN